MKAITALRNNGLSLSSIGSSFRQPDFWDGPALLTTVASDREKIAHDFDGYVEGAFRSNGVVFTVMLIRQLVLSEARFQYQRLENGRPGDLFGDTSLRILEQPWPNGTTGELIARMEQDATLGGNFFATKVGEGNDARLRRMRPDWVTIVTVSPDRPDGSPGRPWDLGAKVGGYIYEPDGVDSSGAVMLTPDKVVHWSPIPDPAQQWRGMSWISAIVEEVKADSSASKHKLKFFENGATSNQFITYDPSISPEKVRASAQLYQEQYAGVDKAYKSIHIGGGADVKMAGADMRQLDFKVTQGAGESRIAAAGLVGAVMAQFSEGMQGSSLNAGNFQSAARRFADVGARPLWRSMSAALSTLVDVPDGARLWYDDRDIPFLQDDAKDAAEILNTNAQAIRQLADGGFKPESVVEAITSGDLRRLVHTGLPSVQVQRPEDTA